MKTKSLSVIIPARNEEALIGATIEAVLRSAADLCAAPGPPDLPGGPVELIVVDNASVDRTAEIVSRYVEDHGVRLVHCTRLKAPCARNFGARHALGDVLVFVDADTLVPPETLRRVLCWCAAEGYEAGITGLASREGGRVAGLWWGFWCLVRRLPLARAKAMPACMFCTRAAYDEFGPFDESVVIGEEWPILAGLYHARPGRLIYDRALVALTSSRRMELQRWGYLRTLCKYAWAIVHVSGRLEYDDRVRHAAVEAE